MISRRHFLSVGVGAALLCGQTGCGLLSQLAWIANGGPKIEAEYDGLEGKKVAVVCVADSVAHGTDVAARELARRASAKLKERVKEVRVIRQEEIEEWEDVNDWSGIDYREIGKALEADAVVAIDLRGFRLRDGQTMYKGRANVTVSVIDIASGEMVFRRNVPEYSFPKTGVQHTTDTTEMQFRNVFVEVLAEHVVRYFYDYELRNTIAEDAALLGG